ncbi:hypothetical protein ABT247_17680 [Kitasatospora sp. NPDC001539]|uniref:hypothetical protein n=1 Tax=unclassified Kitasatospora TaxID=2633591 RepID=UPI00331921BA
MGIFDRFRHRPQGAVGGDGSQRAALAHDEAADAFADEVERSREMQDRLARERLAQEEADRRAAENMTAEGDPWD